MKIHNEGTEYTISKSDKKLICWKVGRYYRETWTSWVNGLRSVMRFNKAKRQVLHLHINNSMQCFRLGKSIPVERDLGVLVENKVSMNEHHAAVAKKVNRMLSYISKGITSTEKEVTVPLCSALLRPHMEYCLQFWSPLCKKDADRLESVQRSATIMIRGLENLAYEGRLRELRLFGL